MKYLTIRFNPVNKGISEMRIARSSSKKNPIEKMINAIPIIKIGNVLAVVRLSSAAITYVIPVKINKTALNILLSKYTVKTPRIANAIPPYNLKTFVCSIVILSGNMKNMDIVKNKSPIMANPENSNGCFMRFEGYFENLKISYYSNNLAHCIMATNKYPVTKSNFMKNSTLFAVIFVAVISVVLITYAVAEYEDSSEQEKGGDVTGYWYQTYYEGYRDGQFVSSENKDVNVSKFALNIYKQEGNIVHGIFNKAEFMGTYRDNVLTFYFDSGDRVSYFTVFVYGDIMYASVSETHDGVSNTFYAEYSKDPLTEHSPIDVIDIMGDWKAYEMFLLRGDEVRELRGDTVRITSQDGMSFKGTQEQVVGDNVVPLDFVGTFFYEKTGNYWKGMFYVAGENWLIYTDGDSITMLTTMVGTTSATKGDLVSVNRQYSRDGTSPGNSIPDLESKKWTIVYEEMALQLPFDPQYSPVNIPISITVNKQVGNLINMTIGTQFEKSDVTGFVIDDDIVFATSSDSSSTHYTGKISGDTMYFTAFDTRQFSGIIYAIASENPLEGLEPKGHWYLLDSKLYVHHSLDMDINVINGTTVKGYFAGCDFEGTLENNVLKFETVLDDGYTVKFEGEVTTINQIVGTITYEKDGEIESESVVFSKYYTNMKSL